jgi:transcriptional regulator with XRE-family HTH domain
VALKVGERIRRIRESKGLKQALIAEELGMTQGAYGKIERGEYDINTARLQQLAGVLEVHICEFFDEKYSSLVSEREISYGFATKEEIDAMRQQIRLLMKEIEKLKSVEEKKGPVKKKSRKK